MRIENNNNIGFGAYFKNNTLLKKTYHSSKGRVSEELIDTFVNKCPNHEVEIISAVERPNYSTVYTLFNNTNHRSFFMELRFACDSMNKILQELTLCKSFWASTDECYEKLIGKK